MTGAGEVHGPREIDLADKPLGKSSGAAGGRVRVLLVEDDPLFASLVRSALAEYGTGFDVASVGELGAALALLIREPVDLVLADLHLPDSQGAATVQFLKRAAPHVPLIVLSGADDVSLALDAIREGAEEYVVKGSFSISSLVWLVLLVLERHRRAMQERGSGYLDPLSGLASLSALQVLGRYLLRVADRTGLHLGVLCLRLQPATRGRWSDWETLLVDASELLRRTLRRCDLLSRVGSLELAVLLVSEGSNLAMALSRLEGAIADSGMAPHVQIGLAVHQRAKTTLDDLLVDARSSIHAVRCER